MVGKSSQDHEHVTYGFGSVGMMSNEWFPLFMKAYCIIVFMGIALTGWMLRGYNAKEKKIRRMMKTADLNDPDATFVPKRIPHRKKRKEESTERGRPRERGVHGRHKKRMVMIANRKESEGDSTSQEE